MDVAKALAEYGAIGLVALIAMLAAWKMYKDKEAQAKAAAAALAECQAKLEALQEKRVNDANQFAEKSIEMVQVSNSLIEEITKPKT